MIIFKTANFLSIYLQERKKRGQKIGFVPTMGALHKGHISLVKMSNEYSDLTVCSIFINRTQFNNLEDFTHYPSTIENDIDSLNKAACDILFLPDESEIYNDGYHAPHYDLGYLEQILEGQFRPGHFQGVCQVVDRLLQIVPASTFYVGQKDYQQCLVIKRLLHLSGRSSEVQLIIAATLREENGLAMSSRNMRLTGEQKLKAAAISKALFFIKENLQDDNVNQLQLQAMQALQNEGFIVDYVEITSADTLINTSKSGTSLVALIAATIGDIRLIDNMILN